MADSELYVLERVEDGRWAVLEPEEGGAPTLTIPRTWLPHQAFEGDVIRVEAEGEGRVRFERDLAARRARAERLRRLREDLPEGPAGDLEL